MKSLLAVTIYIAASASCGKKDKTTIEVKPQSEIPADAPACIRQKIQAILAAPVQDPPTRIVRLTYNGAPAYYTSAACCDQFSNVYDNACNLICHPDGGITGRGDGRCPTFWSTAADSVEIWRDPR